MNRTPSTWKWLIAGWTACVVMLTSFGAAGCRQDKPAGRDEPSRATRLPDEPPSHDAPPREPMH
jgi:hypothetical protein